MPHPRTIFALGPTVTEQLGYALAIVAGKRHSDASCGLFGEGVRVHLAPGVPDGGRDLTVFSKAFK